MINEDRGVSGFPAATNIQSFQEEIDNRRAYYVKVCQNALNQLSSTEMIKCLTDVIEETTDMGHDEAPILINDLVSAFEITHIGELEKHEKKIDSTLELIRFNASKGAAEAIMSTLVDDLLKLVADWDFFAQPINSDKNII
mgnify:CR=1 FL=1